MAVLLFGIPGLASYLVRDAFNSALTGIPLVYAASWLLLILITLLYRISPFHPLAQFPGPWACKASKLWLVYVTPSGKAHEYIHRLHQQYGDIVRIGECFTPRSRSQGSAHACLNRPK